MKNTKIAVALDLDWPLKRYHNLFTGIQHYAEIYTDWIVTWDHFPEYELQKNIDQPYYQGIIGRIKKDIYQECTRLDIPMVNTWRSNDIQSIPSIYSDFTKTAEEVMDHLLSRGFRNIACLDYYNDRSADIFREGIEKICNNTGCTLKNYSFNREANESKEEWHKFRKDFESWVNEWEFPLAIVSTNCLITKVIPSLCKEYGIKIPDQLAIITAENEPTLCENNLPHISAIDFNYYDMGMKAAEMLHQQMLGKKLAEKIVHLPPTEIITRDSTDTFSVRDEYLKKSLRYIVDNISSNFQVNEIVDQVPISRRSLEIRFKNELGHSILEEISRIRVQLAKRLLKDSKMKVIDIQKSVGFATPLQMRRTFSKLTGMSPLKYRKTEAEKGVPVFI